MATSLFIPKENQLTNQYRFIYPPSVFLCTKNVTLRFPFRPKKYVSANLTYHNFEYYYSEFCIENIKGFPSRGYGIDSPSTIVFLQKNWKTIMFFFSKTWKTNYVFRQSFLPKKKCYTYLLHFSTCKHNLVSFFPLAESCFDS
jgi:hypothetical protein